MCGCGVRAKAGENQEVRGFTGTDFTNNSRFLALALWTDKLTSVAVIELSFTVYHHA